MNDDLDQLNEDVERLRDLLNAGDIDKKTRCVIRHEIRLLEAKIYELEIIF